LLYELIYCNTSPVAIVEHLIFESAKEAFTGGVIG